MSKVLILGGYGNFGKRIGRLLARSGVPVIIAGRNRQKAEQLVEEFNKDFPGTTITSAVVDADKDNELDRQLKILQPAVVINTCGPFQQKDYRAAQTCIRHAVHYLDLADGRAFVNGITDLDGQARQAGVWIISGASTVPGLSSAVLEKYKDEFQVIDSLVYGISPGQRTERGLATTQGILSYVGQPLQPVPGDKQPRYGWQNIYRQHYPELGARWMASCDIPDLDLLPPRYAIRQIRFSAGMENPLLHFGLWGLSWPVRLGLPLSLPNYAPLLLRLSHLFDRFGSADGGMHIIIKGTGQDGRPHERRWFIIARNGDGPYIPCVPAAVLARKLAGGKLSGAGAAACVGMVTLEEYLVELAGFVVITQTFVT
jgi:hypothetical protein